jgi:hypothetical protein
VRVTGRKKCNQNFIPKTIKEETTSSVGGVEDPDIYRRLTLKWILPMGICEFGLISLRHMIT